ncbi:hypothetical protein PARPLA_02359 [Rhodobacteraceae bacterium THAF1]|uniref:TrgA family protein n=1 Tax=Palleronia sp. THAF1 TaxID=2587842 RepID=UPI000F3B1CD6|nr:TrgA family protein [Palleronia sp. THAF1]QFU09170.1 hypothetical protein FIU81_10850 [Palleronia sp. THAF1]VDC27248.1 hypothetical protein PARPLA_02359 [Rhodobacteraceae bacterium THAF1]
MPTLSKLVAALVFGAVAFIASGMVAAALPSDVMRVPDYFVPVNVLIGIFIGWTICGAKSGAGYVTAIGVGLTSAISLTVLSLLVWAVAQMMKRTLRLAYDDAIEAILAAISIAIEYGAIVVSQPLVPVVLAVGGVIGGLASEPFAERRPGE